MSNGHLLKTLDFVRDEHQKCHNAPKEELLSNLSIYCILAQHFLKELEGKLEQVPVLFDPLEVFE